MPSTAKLVSVTVAAVLSIGMGHVEGAVTAACMAGTIDLSREQAASAATPYNWTDATDDFLYDLTVCGTTACGDDGPSSGCQRSLNYPPITSLFSWDTSATWTPSSDGFSGTFKNGATCNGAPRASTVNLHCTNTTEAALVSVTEAIACKYNLDFNVPCGPVTCKSYTNQASCDDGSGPSGQNCHWCTSSLLGDSCYSDSEAAALPPFSFSCDYKHCMDFASPKECDVARDGGPKAEACVWCQRLADSTTNTTAATGGCLNTTSAATLPPSVFKCA